MAGEQGVRAGRAFVEMSLKDKAFRQGLAGITRRLGAMGKVLKTVGAGLLGGGLAAGGGILASAKAFSSFGSTLTDMADASGISAQGLSELKYAAEQSGASLEDVNTGVAQMNRNVNNLRRGIPQAERAFSELGLSVQDLADLSPDQQFTLIADRLSKVDDAGQRAALAMEIFGRGGKTLMPLLAQGAEGMNAMRAQARALGVTLSDEDAQAADKLDDALSGLWAQLKALVMNIGAAVAGPLTQIIQVFQAGLAATIQWVDGLGGLQNIFGETFSLMADAVASGGVAEAVDLMFAKINLVWVENVNTLRAMWAGFWEQLMEPIEDFYDAFSRTINRVDAVFAGIEGLGTKGDFAGAFNERRARDKVFEDIIEGEKAGRRNRRAAELNAELAKLAEEVTAAQQALTSARESAREAVATGASGGLAPASPTISAIRTAAIAASEIVAGASASSLFDARFASRVFGGGPADVQQKQLEVLKEIRDNTEDLAEAGGIAVL